MFNLPLNKTALHFLNVYRADLIIVALLGFFSYLLRSMTNDHSTIKLYRLATRMALFFL